MRGGRYNRQSKLLNLIRLRRVARNDGYQLTNNEQPSTLKKHSSIKKQTIMKTIKMGILLIATLCCGSISAQKFQETFNKEVSSFNDTSEKLLVVKNIYGHINVESYDGKTVKIEIEKIIKARSSENLELGKKEISLEIKQKDNTIYAYMNSPYTHFDIETGSFDYSHNNGRNWCCNYGDKQNKINYKYHLNLKVKVPKNVSIKLSTVNDGDIFVENVQANGISVSNINGAITMKNVAGKMDVNSINKDINITYAKNPTKDSTYKSINGDITIIYPHDLNANVVFKSFNGDLYTSFESTVLAPEIEKTEDKNGRGAKIKVGAKARYQIGQGGAVLDFNAFNGDVILKK